MLILAGALLIGALVLALWPMTPPIGVWRTGPGIIIPLMYPGETGGVFNLGATQADLYWYVKPTPGPQGLWLRWQYRLVYRWLQPTFKRTPTP